MPKIKWSLALALKAPMSCGPSIDVATVRMGEYASGSAASAMREPRAVQPVAAKTAVSAKAPMIRLPKRILVAGRPSTTARVRLPARSSVSISLTLLATRIAVARNPTGIARSQASRGAVRRGQTGFRPPLPGRRTGTRTPHRAPGSRMASARRYIRALRESTLRRQR